MSEDQLLNRITVEQYMDRLTPADRCMILLVFEVVYPDDYAGARPATYTDIGKYIGERFEGRALSEAAIRYRRDVVLRMLRGHRGPLRKCGPRNEPESP